MEYEVMTESMTEPLLTNMVTEEFNRSVSSIWNTIFSSRFFYSVLLVVVMFGLFRLIDLVMLPFKKRSGSPLIGFASGILKVITAVVILLRICGLYWLLSGITEQILMSSSLLVVVLGFVFQEGLTNIVHGFILSVSKPFKIGDRVTVTIDGVGITGYIRMMGLRATTIQNILNNAYVSIPNAKLDLGLIQNNYTGAQRSSSSFLDAEITYESDLERAIWLMQECIVKNVYVRAERNRIGVKEPPQVLVRAFGESGISIRGTVLTRTVEENFSACSELRIALKHAYDEDGTVEFAYPHMQIIDSREKTGEA